MTNRELEDALAVLEFVSSVLALQLLFQSRMGSESEELLENDGRGECGLEERISFMEERLCRLERHLGL
jgi:hypothetical protein